jgi:hypothetical protein
MAKNEEFLHARDDFSETLTIEKLGEVDEEECTYCIEYYPEGEWIHKSDITERQHHWQCIHV